MPNLRSKSGRLVLGIAVALRTARRQTDTRQPRKQIQRVGRGDRKVPPRTQLEATRRRATREPNAGRKKIHPDGCQTDPEPGMDSRRATVRNMRSKCRCSCVLQFTFRRAVSCVLHRPPSQVIHCIVLYHFSTLSLN